MTRQAIGESGIRWLIDARDIHTRQMGLDRIIAIMRAEEFSPVLSACQPSLGYPSYTDRGARLPVHHGDRCVGNVNIEYKELGPPYAYAVWFNVPSGQSIRDGFVLRDPN